MIKKGLNCIIGDNVKMGENAFLGHNVIIEDNVTIGENAYIDSNTIIRSNVSIGDNLFIGSNCIIGEYWMDLCIDRQEHIHPLILGNDVLIRSGSIIYAGSQIGDVFQTGHRVTIREKTTIGNNVSIGTLSDIQGDCSIGNYVRLHSNVFVGQLSVIDDFVWIFPHVVLTNDPTPPSKAFIGVHVKNFAIIAASAIIMPGLEIGKDSLVAAGAVVTKPVEPFAVVAGNPGKKISDVRNIKNRFTGEAVYPWRYHFERYMPWSESDFQTWYSGLDVEERKNFGIDNIE